MLLTAETALGGGGCHSNKVARIDTVTKYVSNNLGAGEIAQPVKCLPGKHEDTQGAHMKSCICASNLSAVEAEPGGSWGLNGLSV